MDTQSRNEPLPESVRVVQRTSKLPLRCDQYCTHRNNGLRALQQCGIGVQAMQE